MQASENGVECTLALISNGLCDDDSEANPVELEFFRGNITLKNVEDRGNLFFFLS